MDANATNRDAPPPAGRADTPDALQAELRREAAEGRTLGGDLATDRTLSGSSSWVTLPEPTPDPGRADDPPEAP